MSNAVPLLSDYGVVQSWKTGIPLKVVFKNHLCLIEDFIVYRFFSLFKYSFIIALCSVLSRTLGCSWLHSRDEWGFTALDLSLFVSLSISRVHFSDTHTELSKPQDSRELNSALQLHCGLQTTQMHVKRALSKQIRGFDMRFWSTYKVSKVDWY